MKMDLKPNFCHFLIKLSLVDTNSVLLEIKSLILAINNAFVFVLQLKNNDNLIFS